MRCYYSSSFYNEDEPADKEALGKILFFDPILSIDNTISCASCHKPAYAFADTSAVSIGVNEKKGIRNTPSAMNVALQSVFFWDGRAKDLDINQKRYIIHNCKYLQLDLFANQIVFFCFYIFRRVF